MIAIMMFVYRGEYVLLTKTTGNAKAVLSKRHIVVVLDEGCTIIVSNFCAMLLLLLLCLMNAQSPNSAISEYCAATTTTVELIYHGSKRHLAFGCSRYHWNC